MPRPVHFEMHASDPETSIAFYTALFGWRFTAWGPPGMYWVVDTAPDVPADAKGPGIDGGLVPRRSEAAAEGQGVNAFVCTVEVPDVSAAMARAVELGGTVALPRMPIPGVGWLGYVKDPDGNIMGLMQNDPSAA